MSTIVTRSGKGSALTWTEADANFANLNTDKIESETIHNATSKATPVDADEVPVVDSASSYSLKKLTWANIKATLKTYFDTLYWGGASTDIVSAATLDLTSVRGIVRVTGTTATTAVTITTGQRVECIAVGAWPLTYHATNMPLPTSGFNYTCSAGDKVIFSKDNSGALFVQIEKKSGYANAGGGDQAITLGALGTQAQITSDTDDWGLNAGWAGARISSDAARNVTGIASGWSGRVLTLHNVGAYAITLKDESASSTAANRFALTSDLVLQPDAAVLLQYDATTSRWRLVGATPTSEAYIYLREEQTSGTNGGTFTSGAWQKRTLNTEVNDAGGHASIASSVITLAAGTYRFRARAPAYAVAAHQVRLANTSDSTYFYGSSCLAPVGASHQGDSVVSGRFTIASSKNFELQHRCGTTSSTYGFGNAGSFGGVEVYAEIEFWKES